MSEPLFILSSYSGDAVATDLASPILGSSDPSFTIINASTWVETHGPNAGQPLGTSGPFVLVTDAELSSEEHILCSAVNTSTGLVTVYNVGGFFGRGFDGTNAVAHSTSSGTGYVYPIFSSWDAYQANAAAAAIGKATTAGDLLVAVGPASFTRLGIGASGTWLNSTGTAIQWAPVPAKTVTPTIKASGPYSAQNGDYVEATATLTVTSPAAANAQIFGVVANYAATNASPVFVQTATGFFVGPGIGASINTLPLASPGAHMTCVCDGTNWLITDGTFDGGWIDFSAIQSVSWATTGSPDAFYRKVGNTVRLNGPMGRTATGTETLVATMPAGYRPSMTVSGAAAVLNHGPGTSVSPAFVACTTAGALEVFSPSTTPTFGDLLYLDGITWTTD